MNARSNSGRLQVADAPLAHQSSAASGKPPLWRRPAPFAMTQPRNATSHLFDSWEHVSKRVRAAIDIRIFLDFDGTLVRYHDRPEEVKLSSKCRRILEKLSRHRRVRLAIVSGRRNAALRKYIQVPHMKLLGLFGWEKPGRPALPRKTRVALRRLRSEIGRAHV